MMSDSLTRESVAPQAHHGAIVAAFRAGRQTGVALAGFPGELPTTQDESYALQDLAIAQWPDKVVGWKVGRILGDLAVELGADRLIGPVFERGVHMASTNRPTRFTAITGGFCAVEAEYVFKLGTDAPTDGKMVSDDEALDLVGALHIGVEIAGSPLATINELGPNVIVSDFGNNAGLIVGPAVENWRDLFLDLTASTTIDGVDVGTGTVRNFTGGIARSLSFAINTAAKRGLHLKNGLLISTGAVSGVHDIHAGQSAVADFGAHGAIECACVAQEIRV